MTDRLREKAEELAHALWCDAVDGYDESFLIMKIAVPMIHAVLLSARDEALEEAAGVVDRPYNVNKMRTEVNGVRIKDDRGNDLFIAAVDVQGWADFLRSSIRSLKSKVTP